MSSRPLKCPVCQKAVVWDTRNPFRPFCSERCKLIDLGAWASEQHAIPGEPDFSRPEEDHPEERPLH